MEMEVDQYLSDPNQGTDILHFWQVILNFHNFYSNFLTNKHFRNINIDILGFLDLRWTSYLFKHQVFHVNVFSLLERRR